MEMEERKRKFQELIEKRRSELENKVKTEEPKYPYELFGIECGNGWKSLYEPILEYIKEYNETHKENIEIHQIKEKFGGLRIYPSFYTDELMKMIDEAEEKSYGMCENCGKPCKQINVGHWIYTLCQDCYEEMKQKQEKAMLELQNKIKERKRIK